MIKFFDSSIPNLRLMGNAVVQNFLRKKHIPDNGCVGKGRSKEKPELGLLPYCVFASFFVKNSTFSGEEAAWYDGYDMALWKGKQRDQEDYRVQLCIRNLLSKATHHWL